MKLRAVLFDLDDTLHDKSATLRAVAVRQYASCGLAILGIAEHDWQTQYVELNNLRIEKTEVFARLRDHYSLPPALAASLLADYDNNLGAEAQPYAGALALVEACRARGIRTGVATNGRDAFQRSKILGMGLAESLDAVVTSGGLGIKKPDPRIFHTCLEMLGIKSQEAAFVGDDFEADMQPALQLGMTAIWKSALPSSAVAFSSDNLDDIQYFLLSLISAR